MLNVLVCTNAFILSFLPSCSVLESNFYIDCSSLAKFNLILFCLCIGLFSFDPLLTENFDT